MIKLLIDDYVKLNLNYLLQFGDIDNHIYLILFHISITMIIKNV